MNKANLEVARRFMETYANGDAEALVACLTEDWLLHEENGDTTTREAITDITRSHADSFPEKSIEYLHELADESHVAHHVRFTLVHSGRYHDLEPTVLVDRPATH